MSLVTFGIAFKGGDACKVKQNEGVKLDFGGNPLAETRPCC